MCAANPLRLQLYPWYAVPPHHFDFSWAFSLQIFPWNELKGSHGQNKPLPVAGGWQGTSGAGRGICQDFSTRPLPPCSFERLASPPRAHSRPEPRAWKQEQIRMEGRHLMGASQMGEKPDDRLEALPEVSPPPLPAVHQIGRVLSLQGFTRALIKPGRLCSRI